MGSETAYSQRGQAELAESMAICYLLAIKKCPATHNPNNHRHRIWQKGHTSNGGSRRPKKIVKVWSMMLAVMMVVAKVEVAAAAAAAAAAGMLPSILVLLVASSPFTCLLQQFQPTLS